MTIEKKEGVHSGDYFHDSSARGAVIGQLLEKQFPVVAAVADGVLITAVQAHLFGPNRPFRIRGVSAVAETITGAATFDVYDNAGTPATILSAAKAFGAAKTLAAGVVADQTVVYAAGTYLTFRVTTAASTGALGNVHAQIEYEILPA